MFNDKNIISTNKFCPLTQITFICILLNHSTPKDIQYEVTWSCVTFSIDHSATSLPNIEVLNPSECSETCCPIGQYIQLSCIWLDGQRWIKGYPTWSYIGNSQFKGHTVEKIKSKIKLWYYNVDISTH